MERINTSEVLFDIFIAVATITLLALATCFCVQTFSKPVVIPEPEIQAPPPDTLTDWQMLTLAFILTESKCDTLAVGGLDDYGALQLRPIYVAEANRLSGASYTHDDALSLTKSLEMFDIVQGYYNPGREVDLAIKVHNPGSGGYAYRQNIALVRRFEDARRAVLRHSL